MPARLPIRSKRYAVSRGSSRKQAPTISPGPAVTAATARKTAGSTSQIGGPVVLTLVKNSICELFRSTVTGIRADEADQTQQHDERVVRLWILRQVLAGGAQEAEADAEERAE